jgi:hypothetical protein
MIGMSSHPWTRLFDTRRLRPLRWVLVFGAGVLCGLAIHGSGLFAARGPAARAVPPEDVALVNHRPILRTDFIARTETGTGKTYGEATPAERLKVLNDMVREELFVQRGLELGVPGTDPETREALVAAVERQAVADVTATVPSDAQLGKYFQDNRGKYASEGEMTLHNLLLPKSAGAVAEAMATARKAVEKLRGGAAVAEVVKAYGLDDVVPEHAGVEQFYFAEEIHLGAALFAQALKLDDGDASEPIAAADGIHILLMVKNKRPVQLAFERVRGQVLNDYIASAKQQRQDADEHDLRAKADIRIADDLGGSGKP